MEWEPISETAIWENINEACLRMSPPQAKTWEAIRIIPEKWQQSPWGNRGGGFWAVAIIGRLVVWFNDIEDGFNVSRYSQHRVIDEYWCNQDELEVAVQRVMNILESGYDGSANAGPPIPTGA
ncbi:MAG TPA: hypothetical protein VEC06_17260 [Paucimonas sp.]|nr:hypothetical protein [Paucimonas sp.]